MDARSFSTLNSLDILKNGIILPGDDDLKLFKAEKGLCLQPNVQYCSNYREAAN